MSINCSLSIRIKTIKTLLRFETVDQYKKWAYGPYAKKHMALIVLPDKIIYVKLIPVTKGA